MKQHSLLLIPVGLLLSLLIGGAFLLSTLHSQGGRSSVLGISQAVHQIDTQQCYHDPHVQIIASQATNAGDGRMVFSLDSCPGQRALFGQFSLLETDQSLMQGGCLYLQNDLAAHSSGGFQGSCAPQIHPGSVQTAPVPNDGRVWQACWIDDSVALPKPICTAFHRVP